MKIPFKKDAVSREEQQESGNQWLLFGLSALIGEKISTSESELNLVHIDWEHDDGDHIVFKKSNHFTWKKDSLSFEAAPTTQNEFTLWIKQKRMQKDLISMFVVVQIINTSLIRKANLFSACTRAMLPMQHALGFLYPYDINLNVSSSDGCGESCVSSESSEWNPLEETEKIIKSNVYLFSVQFEVAVYSNIVLLDLYGSEMCLVKSQPPKMKPR